VSTSRFMRLTGWPCVAAVTVSLGVLIVASCLFGFRFAAGTKWQGRIAGVVGTGARIAAAVGGLKMAQRAERPSHQTF
jgi:hypothetical protein